MLNNKKNIFFNILTKKFKINIKIHKGTVCKYQFKPFNCFNLININFIYIVYFQNQCILNHYIGGKTFLF